jgi:nanoRNase/pAp phosphatase (c-di-AMP/oligoRNAs hydrolase)
MSGFANKFSKQAFNNVDKAVLSPLRKELGAKDNATLLDMVADIEKYDSKLSEKIRNKQPVSPEEIGLLAEKIRQNRSEEKEKNQAQDKIVIHRMSRFGIVMSVISALIFLAILLVLLFRKSTT